MKVDRWRTLVNSWVLCHSQTCTTWQSVWMWCVVQSAANVELVEAVSRGQIVSLPLWDERRHSELTKADWDHNEEDQWTPHCNSLTERTQSRWLVSMWGDHYINRSSMDVQDNDTIWSEAITTWTGVCFLERIQSILPNESELWIFLWLDRPAHCWQR